MFSNLRSLSQDDQTAYLLDTPFGPRWRVERISDPEIAHLVATALEEALYALGRTNPKSALESRAKEAQSGLCEQFQSLPGIQRSDPTVLAEYRKAVVHQYVTRDLALQMVNAIQRYAAASEHEVSNQAM